MQVLLRGGGRWGQTVVQQSPMDFIKSIFTNVVILCPQLCEGKTKDCLHTLLNKPHTSSASVRFSGGRNVVLLSTSSWKEHLWVCLQVNCSQCFCSCDTVRWIWSCLIHRAVNASFYTHWIHSLSKAPYRVVEFTDGSTTSPLPQRFVLKIQLNLNYLRGDSFTTHRSR